MNPLNNLPGVGATAKDLARAKDPGMRSAAEAATAQDPARRDARPDPGPASDTDGAFWQRRRVEAVPWLSAASAPLRPPSDVAPASPPAPPRSGAPASRVPHR